MELTESGRQFAESKEFALGLVEVLKRHQKEGVSDADGPSLVNVYVACALAGRHSSDPLTPQETTELVAFMKQHKALIDSIAIKCLAHIRKHYVKFD